MTTLPPNHFKPPWDGYTATSPLQSTVTVVGGDILEPNYLTLPPDVYGQFFGTRVIGFQPLSPAFSMGIEYKPEPTSMNRHQRRKAARNKRRR